ncbi:MAG: PP2C family protein-serine/threonine phosphatase [bacterium]
MNRDKQRWFSFRIETALLFIVSVLLSALILETYTLETQRKSLTYEFVRRILTQTRGVSSTAAGAILLQPTESILTLYPLCVDVVENDKDCNEITIIDRNGIIRGSNDAMNINKEFKSDDVIKQTKNIIELKEGESLGIVDDNFVIITPILKSGIVVGQVRASYSQTSLTSTLSKIKINILILGLVAIIIGLITSLFLSNRIVSPIMKIVSAAKELGQGNLDVKVDIKSKNELGVLAHSFNEMAVKLKEAQKEFLEKERIKKELEVAHNIQQGLLPQSFPSWQGLEIHGICRSAYIVGGDYFDVMDLGEDRLGIIIVDISGKGLSGLLAVTLVRGIIRSQVRRHLQPKKVLIETNLLITPDFQKMRFATAIYGLYHHKTRTFTFANAGHTAPIVYNSELGSTFSLKSNGRPLFLFYGKNFDERIEEKQVILKPGDEILLYTDGVIEATSPKGEEFGEERLANLISTISNLPLKEQIITIFNKVRVFSGNENLKDDLTIVGIKEKID